MAAVRAANHARRLHKPLVIFEALRADYPWASDRIHRFVLDGMADNARERNHLDESATSGFSPYLNFGYLGTHQVLAELAWRELGLNFAAKRDDFGAYDSLPA